MVNNMRRKKKKASWKLWAVILEKVDAAGYSYCDRCG